MPEYPRHFLTLIAISGGKHILKKPVLPKSKGSLNYSPCKTSGQTSSVPFQRVPGRLRSPPPRSSRRPSDTGREACEACEAHKARSGLRPAARAVCRRQPGGNQADDDPRKG